MLALRPFYQAPARDLATAYVILCCHYLPQPGTACCHPSFSLLFSLSIPISSCTPYRVCPCPSPSPFCTLSPFPSVCFYTFSRLSLPPLPPKKFPFIRSVACCSLGGTPWPGPARAPLLLHYISWHLSLPVAYREPSSTMNTCQ